MAAWIGPAIGAIGGVISSLFGGKKKETTNHVDYKRMVRDAEAAGFNPLTVLRNGGSAGYMATTHPALSSGERIGGALGHIGNFLADFDPYADQKRELESRLVEATINNLNAQTASIFPPAPGKPGSFNVPTWAAANTEQRPSRIAGRLSASLPASAGAPQTPTIEAPTVTNPNPISSGLYVDPDQPDAEMYETRYGDSEFWNFIDGTTIRFKDWKYNKFREYDRLIRQAGPLSERRKRREEKLKKYRRDAEKNARDLMFPPHLMR